VTWGCSSSSMLMVVSPPALWTFSGTAVRSRKKRQMNISRSVSSPDFASHYHAKLYRRLARSMGFSCLVVALVSLGTISTRIGSAHRCTGTLLMTSSLTWRMLHNHVFWGRWHRFYRRLVLIENFVWRDTESGLGWMIYALMNSIFEAHDCVDGAL